VRSTSSRSDYTAESWSRVQDAATAARTVVEDEDALRAEVGGAVHDLRAAVVAIVSSPQTPAEPNSTPPLPPNGDAQSPNQTAPSPNTGKAGASNEVRGPARVRRGKLSAR